MDKQELDETRHLQIYLTQWGNRREMEPEERKNELTSKVNSFLPLSEDLMHNVCQKENSGWTLRKNYALEQGYLSSRCMKIP